MGNVDWGALVAQWKKSGLSQTAFAKEAGIKAHSLNYHIRALDAGSSKKPSKPAHQNGHANGFSRVGEAEKCFIETAGGSKIYFAADIEPEALRKLLKVANERDS